MEDKALFLRSMYYEKLIKKFQLVGAFKAHFAPSENIENFTPVHVAKPILIRADGKLFCGRTGFEVIRIREFVTYKEEGALRLENLPPARKKKRLRIFT